MSRESRVVLNYDVDVAEMPLQRISRVDRIGACRVEYDVDGTHGFMDSVGYREPGIGNLSRGVPISIADRLPRRIDGVHDVGSR